MSLAQRLQIFAASPTGKPVVPELMLKTQELALKKAREIKELTFDSNREIYELADAVALNIMVVETFLKRLNK